MKKVIFALAIFSSSISYCQFPKAVVNTKVFNFNLTSKIPLNITDPKSLGRKIMNGSITTLYKYSVNNTEHLVLIPSDTIPGPQIHFIKKNNDEYEINLIFNNNAHIALTTETIEVTLDDQNEIKD